MSESAAYRALVRLNLIDPAARRPRDRKWKRWERGAPMELWQMDVVGGFVLADGSRVKALTGIDDHSRFLRQRPADDAGDLAEGVWLAAALAAYGVPEQILTDNGKVFTGRFSRPAVEVLFDRICRETTGSACVSRFDPSLPTASERCRQLQKVAAPDSGKQLRPHQVCGVGGRQSVAGGSGRSGNRN